MVRGRITNTFHVLDDAGGRHIAWQLAIPRSSAAIGGGHMPEEERFELEDGTQIEPMVGARQFIARATGRMYRRE